MDSNQQSSARKSLYKQLGERQNKAMLNKLVNAKSLKPTFTVPKLFAFILAALVHLLSVGLVILGIAIIASAPTELLAIFLGLACLGTAWLMRPRLGRWPKIVLPREKYPVLYRLVDHVANTLNAQPVDAIVMSLDFNATFQRVGWRRKSVLTLGYPLLAILDEQEKIALIAHELAHDVNGDFTQSVFVGSACDTLVHWWWFFEPPGRLPIATTQLIAMRGIGGFLAIPPRFLLFVLRHLMLNERRRAEFFADSLAASVSGSDAALSLLRKLELRQTFYNVLRQTAEWGGKNDNLFSRFRERMAKLSLAELEQMSEEQREKQAQLNSTHPPLIYRIELLKAHYVQKARIEAAPQTTTKLERELTPVQQEVQARLLQMWKDRDRYLPRG